MQKINLNFFNILCAVAVLIILTLFYFFYKNFKNFKEESEKCQNIFFEKSILQKMQKRGLLVDINENGLKINNFSNDTFKKLNENTFKNEKFKKKIIHHLVKINYDNIRRLDILLNCKHKNVKHSSLIKIIQKNLNICCKIDYIIQHDMLNPNLIKSVAHFNIYNNLFIINFLENYFNTNIYNFNLLLTIVKINDILIDDIQNIITKNIYFL